MPGFKCVMVFERGRFGWTETFYRDEDNAAACVPRLNDLAVQRRRFLVNQAWIRHLRVSDVNNERDARFVTLQGNNGQGQVVVQHDDAEIYQAAVNARLFGNPNTWRSYLICGIHEDHIDVAVQNQVVVQAFIDLAMPFFNALNTNGWRLQKRGFGAQQAITDIIRLGDRFYRFTAAAPIAGAAINSKVQIRGVLGCPSINGIWRLQNVANAPIYHIFQKPGLNPGVPEPNTGNVRLVTFTYPNIETPPAFVGVTTRRLGRPLYQPVGKR